MQDNELLNQIAELTAKINDLPKGYISKKQINGKVYYYHQWSQSGVKQSRYLHDSEIEPLAGQIEQRKALQAKLRALKAASSAVSKKRNEVNSLKCTLMHKRIQVAELELDDATGFIQKIGTVYAPEHLPVQYAEESPTGRRSMSGGQTAPSPPAAPVCVRRWRRWKAAAPKCCWCAALC